MSSTPIITSTMNNGGTDDCAAKKAFVIEALVLSEGLHMGGNARASFQLECAIVLYHQYLGFTHFAMSTSFLVQ